MKTKAQKIRLGIFFIVSIGILLLILGYFTTRHFFEQKDTYYVAYHDVSVSGLEVGSPVKYLGINIGSISDIKIDPKDFSSIIVELSIRPGTPIKEDAVADIVAIGITGLKTIEIRGGTPETDFLKEGNYIQAGSSLADDITGKAEVIAFKAEQVLNNLQVFTHPDNLNKITESVDNISEVTKNFNTTITKANNVIEENRSDVRETIIALNDLSTQLGKSSHDLDDLIAGVNNIVRSDTITNILGNLGDISYTLKEANLSRLIENFADLTEQSQRLLVKIDDDLDRSSQEISENLSLLKITLENLSETSRKISTNPSLLIRSGRDRETGPDIIIED